MPVGMVRDRQNAGSSDTSSLPAAATAAAAQKNKKKKRQEQQQEDACCQVAVWPFHKLVVVVSLQQLSRGKRDWCWRLLGISMQATKTSRDTFACVVAARSSAYSVYKWFNFIRLLVHVYTYSSSGGGGGLTICQSIVNLFCCITSSIYCVVVLQQ